MAIPEEKLTEITDHVDIVDLVQSYGIKLEKAGKGYRGLCPFHDDKSPSFHVSVEKKIAKCMSCGEGGLPITFVMKIENCSFEEACHKLAVRYGVQLDVTISSKEKNKYTKYFELMSFANGFYQNFLEKSINRDKALDYLHKRRLSDETISMFSIGLAPAKPDALCQTASSQGYLNDDLVMVGLAKQSEKKYFDLFRNRILFPIQDEYSNVVGFSGRRFLDESKDEPKYINSPETILFKKGTILYNLNNAKIEIKRKKRLVLFEGFMDVIAAYNAGIKEGVCSMGTALTQEHADLIKRNTDNVIISYDGDEPGIEATFKAIKILSSRGLNIQILSLPEGLDPDEYIGKYGAEAFRKLFDSDLSDPLKFQYEATKRNKNLDNYQSAEDFKKYIFSLIRATNSNTIIEKYCSRLAIDLGVSKESIANDYNSNYKSTALKNFVENNGQKKNNLSLQSSYEKAEKMLIKHMTINKNRALKIAHGMSGHPFISDENYFIYIALIEDYYKEQDEFVEINFLLRLTDKARSYYESTINPTIIAKDEVIALKEISELLENIQRYHFYCDKKQANEKIKKSNDSVEKVQLLSERDSSIKKIINKGGKTWN